jgi:hypothetical protein
VTDLNPKALEAAIACVERNETKAGRPASRQYTYTRCRLAITAYLEAAGDGWQPIATFSDDVSGQIVALNVRGQAMVWDAKRLRENLSAQLPDHLQFHATRWMRLSAPPKGGA